MRPLFAVSIVALAATSLVPALAEDPHRELGPHVHGQGALDVAIEGNRLVMEFRAPGADVAGFEGKAGTAEAKAAQTAAAAALENPLELFKLPDAAKCSIVSAKVTVDDDDDDDHAQAPPEAAPSKDGKDQKPATEAQHQAHEHSDYTAAYELSCAEPAALTSIEFAYFKKFQRAQKVGVQAITAKGQNAFEATPAKPVIDLTALVR